MKIILFAICLFCSASFASELTFHLECPPKGKDCKDVTIARTGETVRVERTPSLTYGVSDFSDIAISVDDKNEQVYQLSLKPEPAKQLAEVTGANVGKLMVVMDGDKGLLAPRIKEALKTESFQLAPGTGGPDAIPWLKQAWENREPSTPYLTLNMLGLLWLVGLALAVPIYFLVREKKIKSV